MPLVFSGLALFFQEYFWEHIHSHKFLFFYPAVMASGWFSGRLGALITTVISSVACYFFLLEPTRLTETLSRDEIIPLVVFVAIGFMISHYLHVEERVISALELKTRELEESNLARTSFLAYVSHEIRTPLNAILGYAQLLENATIEGENRAMLHRIRSSGDYLLSILNKILDFKKMEASLLKLDPKPIDLIGLFKEIDHTLKPSVEAKCLKMRLELPDLSHLHVQVDALRIRQILINLCSNATKFTETGSVTLRLRLLHMDEQQVSVLIEVQDTGIGIPESRIPSLFNPFTQADASIAGRFGGSGLGLSIVKQLVELMGGKLGVESRLSHGTLFWVELALERVLNVNDIPSPKAISSLPHQQLRGLRVLAADDNPINLVLLEQIISREGGTVYKTVDGRAALNQLTDLQGQIDVILLDLHMPVLDGIEAVREIRAHSEWAQLPVLAYTAETQEFSEERDAINLFDGIIEKPIQINALIETLSRFRSDPLDLLVSADSKSTSLKIISKSISRVSLPSCVDAERVRILFGEDLGLFQSCLRQFQNIFENAAVELSAYLKGKETAMAVDALHNIRGAAANLGFVGLASSALALEEVLNGHPEGFDPELHGNFTRLLHEVLSIDLNQDHSPQINSLHLQRDESTATVHALAVALAESNLAAIDMALSLESILIEKMSPRAITTFQESLETLDFASALDALTQGFGDELQLRRETPGSGAVSEVA